MTGWFQGKQTTHPGRRNCAEIVDPRCWRDRHIVYAQPRQELLRLALHQVDQPFAQPAAQVEASFAVGLLHCADAVWFARKSAVEGFLARGELAGWPSTPRAPAVRWRGG